MTYNLNIPLPEGWTSEIDQYEEVENAVITHLQCHLPDGKGEDEVLIECYIGDMPSDTTAEDEAYANYADIIGWDDDDDDECPIAEWKFQNRRAYGFSGLCENGFPMLFMCTEIRKDVLLIVCVIAPDDDQLSEWSKYVEYHLRVSR